jgi:tripartite-type tricarboxylate transporter receptor subunit TctC
MVSSTSLTLRRIIVMACMLAVPGPVAAQDAYPNRVVKIIVPVVPGIAAADVLPRLIADKLNGRFKQPFIVENKPGANSNIGAEFVAEAEPDGYTLLATPPPPLVTNQFFYSKLNFDPSGFVSVTIIASLPNVLVVNAKERFGTLQEFIAYAKANPDKLTYGSPGVGSSPYLAMEWFKHLAGVQITHVPYNGISPIVKDVVAGTIDMTFANTFTVLPQIKAGQMRALGVDSAKRFEDLPDVPAVSETFPGFVVTSWFAIVAPPKTAPQIAEKLSSAIADVLQEPDVAARLRDLSAAGIGNSPSEAAKFIAAERERYHHAVEASGLKAIE